MIVIVMLLACTWVTAIFCVPSYGCGLFFGRVIVSYALCGF